MVALVDDIGVGVGMMVDASVGLGEDVDSGNDVGTIVGGIVGAFVELGEMVDVGCVLVGAGDDVGVWVGAVVV